MEGSSVGEESCEHAVDDDETKDADGNRSSVPEDNTYQISPFFRQTRKGKILKSVHEHYCRDDLGLGCVFLPKETSSYNDKVDRLVGEPKTIQCTESLVNFLDIGSRSHPPIPFPLVVVDTNVVLHNLDVLQQICARTSTTIAVSYTHLTLPTKA